ncbi:hypothetical protein [Legionella cardiaca]|uniref:Uncharacterized protein n=1 Tax=Legionella cardiaca TaxID=1071983 RepID=A0ABY8AQB9_9GAMM|nr:hypothetical protein [Legionella cardiaca]WED42416.1 hypothetical protein PXX05_10875 [Legionella cardiaca]
MKRYLPLFALATGIFSTFSIQAANNQILIQGKQAKTLYNSLTGPKVQEDGAAGHLYRQASVFFVVIRMQISLNTVKIFHPTLPVVMLVRSS